MKKLISLLLALLMIVGLLSTAAFAESSGQTITAPGEYTLYAPYRDYSVNYFTPTESGFYTFRSVGARYDPISWLYLEGKEIVYSSGSSDGLNFCFSAELEEGTKYELQIGNLEKTENIKVEILSGRHDGGPATSDVADGLGRYTVTAGGQESAELYFTPTESGVYTFKSSSNNGVCPSGWLYDQNGNLLQNDYGENTFDFCISSELKSGEPYKLEIRIHTEGYFTFDVVIGKEISSQGSILSQGNITIVVGIAGVALGLVGGFLLGRKKKPAASSSNEE